jgi:hypothetical protein
MATMGLSEFVLNLVIDLVSNVIYDRVSSAELGFFQRRKIQRRVEDAVADVVEPLLPFLAQEHIEEDKQRRLIETCVNELRPLTEQPELLLRGSLDGQKVFDELYANRDFPRVIMEDGLRDVYALLGPRIATLLCQLPVVVKQWENEAWAENFRRLDEFTYQMRALFDKVDTIATRTDKDTDATLATLRRTLIQKAVFQLDLTGLRADQPTTGRFDDFFVQPEISQIGVENPRVVGTGDDSYNCFASRGVRSIVVGAPGSGKSTWAKWLQRESLVNQRNSAAIRVELRRFSKDSLPSIHEIVRDVAGKHLEEEVTGARIRQWLDHHQILFVFDGFDEVAPSNRNEVTDWLVELCTAAPECSVVLTSRPLTTTHLDQLGWQQWSMSPFDNERIIDYMQRWYAYTPLLLEMDREIDVKALASDWQNDPTIGPLTGNPLLLSTLLMVHHLDGRLPNGRSQLYNRYIDGMLGIWDDRRQVEVTVPKLSRSEKRRVLRGLALHMFILEQDQLDEDATTTIVMDLIQEMELEISASDALVALRERSGLIIGPGVYSFVHKSVAEYLVAETLLEGDQRDSSGNRLDRWYLLDQRDNDRWNTVTFLWAGLAPTTDVESFIHACIEGGSPRPAFGVLMDQYERIPKHSRRQLLLEGASKDQKTVHRGVGTYHWHCPRPRGLGDPAPEMPRLELRSVAGPLALMHLMDRALRDGTLIWPDADGMQPLCRDLLWMLTLPFRDFDHWMDSLTAACPMGDPFFWQIFRLFHFIIVLLEEGKESLDVISTITAFLEACPLVRGTESLMIMGAIVHMHQWGAFQARSKQLEMVLEALPIGDRGTINKEWLSATRSWNFYTPDVPDEINDLLLMTDFTINQLIDRGVLELDGISQAALTYVSELIMYRETLTTP